MSKEFDNILSALKLVFATSKIRDENRTVDTNDEEELITDFFDEERTKVFHDATNCFGKETDGDTDLPDHFFEDLNDAYYNSIDKLKVKGNTNGWNMTEEEARDSVYDEMLDQLLESTIFPAIDEFKENKD